MKIILTGGGTAGHVNPALAIAEEIRAQEKDADILFIGRLGGKENSAVKDAGISLEYLEVKGIERRITVKNAKNILTALRARRSATEIIKRFNPDAVVGTGGYVSWPVISAAQKLGIPTAVHESNLYPGLTTRLLAKKCSLLLLNREETKEYLGKGVKVKTVGNPLRKDFFTTDRVAARRELRLSDKDFLVVSFGGSGGAQQLNDNIIELMKSYSRRIKRIRHIHGCGRSYYKEINEPELKRGTDGCKIRDYIDNMPTLMHAADLVISRCGAMTLSEIGAVGVASILIPSPNVTGNHQYKNAKQLCDAGAAVMIEEQELTPSILKARVNEIFENENFRKAIAKKIENPNSKKAASIALSAIKGIFAKKS